MALTSVKPLIKAPLQLQLKMSTVIDTSTLNKQLIWYQYMLKSIDYNVFLMCWHFLYFILFYLHKFKTQAIQSAL